MSDVSIRREPPLTQVESLEDADALSSPAEPKMRADARRNRELLLEATVERFAADGADAPLEAIARQAGVGIGTLYRHFPTRDALVEAAYRNEVTRLEDSATDLLAELPPDQALAEWLDRYVSYATAKRGLGSALRSIAAAKADLYPQTRQRLQAAVATLLAAGQQSGALRSDVDAEDVFRAVSGVWTIPEGPDFAERARRLLGLLMDGLRRS
jgi:AcrR family transcriptional regulator